MPIHCSTNTDYYYNSLEMEPLSSPSYSNNDNKPLQRRRVLFWKWMCPVSMSFIGVVFFFLTFLFSCFVVPPGSRSPSGLWVLSIVHAWFNCPCVIITRVLFLRPHILLDARPPPLMTLDCCQLWLIAYTRRLHPSSVWKNLDFCIVFMQCFFFFSA